ncbi:MAG: radical SAM protein [Candidatus Brocadiaceae bacterium]|nr:radical SAM protein [Candidatus Brocadiaceae bacterium]
MQSFKTVYFDIVGFCNAKCPYCHSGIHRIGRGNKIPVELFEKTLMKLLDKNVITKGTVISLYSWGEPFLYNEIHNIINCINKLDLKYAVSTNASQVPFIDKAFVKNLDHIVFSMPGFSQESYSRIHGFDFEDIIHNIVTIVKDCRNLGFKGTFTISYHVYKFNIEEIKKCEQFADDHEIVFRPYYAILNHWWMLQDFVNKRFSKVEADKVLRNIFNLEDIENKMKSSPKDYVCPQFNYLIIDENAHMITCCQLARNHKEYSCGNILDTDIEIILNKRKNHKVCRECVGSGLAYYLNNSMAMPDFYRRSAKQKVLALKQRIKKTKDLSLGAVLNLLAKTLICSRT